MTAICNHYLSVPQSGKAHGLLYKVSYNCTLSEANICSCVPSSWLSDWFAMEQTRHLRLLLLIAGLLLLVIFVSLTTYLATVENQRSLSLSSIIRRRCKEQMLLNGKRVGGCQPIIPFDATCIPQNAPISDLILPTSCYCDFTRALVNESSGAEIAEEYMF